MQCVSISATGANITTGAASARIAIPVDAAGSLPKKIRVTAGTAASYFKMGNSTVTAEAGDALINVADGVVLKVCGNTHIAAIQQVLAGILNVIPLEDG